MWPNIACSLFVFFVIVFFWTGMVILPIYWPWNVKFILQKIRHAKTSLECSFSNSDVFWLQCISYGLNMTPIHWFDVSWYMLWSSSYYLHHQQVQNYLDSNNMVHYKTSSFSTFLLVHSSFLVSLLVIFMILKPLVCHEVKILALEHIVSCLCIWLWLFLMSWGVDWTYCSCSEQIVYYIPRYIQRHRFNIEMIMLFLSFFLLLLTCEHGILDF